METLPPHNSGGLKWSDVVENDEPPTTPTTTTTTTTTTSLQQPPPPVVCDDEVTYIDEEPQIEFYPEGGGAVCALCLRGVRHRQEAVTSIYDTGRTEGGLPLPFCSFNCMWTFTRGFNYKTRKYERAVWDFGTRVRARDNRTNYELAGVNHLAGQYAEVYRSSRTTFWKR